MSEDCKTPKVVSTLLYTEASEKVNQQVAQELKVPDPDSEVAAAAIKEATHETKDGK